MKTAIAKSDCCRQAPEAVPEGLPKVVLVGSPNVGKSLFFNRLTGVYVSVSNYPGTTVEVSRGKARWSGREFEVIDTPGMYSLRPLTEEERVTRSILLQEWAGAVLHVVDAKNLARMLPLTLQLIEGGLPVVLVLHMIDESDRLGIRIDAEKLGALLGVTVVSVVAMTLFIPCIAQFSMTVKERGWKMAVAMAAFIFPFAFVVGYAVNKALLLPGVVL